MPHRSGALSRLVLAAALAVPVAWACGCVEERGAAPPPNDHGGNVPHADHTPHHGGQVGMAGDVHVEVVASEDGQHRVYLTDAVRKPISAAGRAGTLTVTRPDGSTEKLVLRPNGDAYLFASGRPLGPGNVMSRVETSVGSQAVLIDFLVSGEGVPKPAAAADRPRRRFIIPPGQRGGRMTPTRIFP